MRGGEEERDASVSITGGSARGGEEEQGLEALVMGGSAREESPQAFLKLPSQDIIQAPLKSPPISLKSPSEDIVQGSGAKRKHTNWGRGEACDRMSTAVEDWLGEKGRHYDDNGELIMDQTVYATMVGIPRGSI